MFDIPFDDRGSFAFTDAIFGRWLAGGWGQEDLGSTYFPAPIFLANPSIEFMV